MQLHASIVDHFSALTFRVSRIMLSKGPTRLQQWMTDYLSLWPKPDFFQPLEQGPDVDT